jgi:DNA polymerase-3 subunit beta
VEIRVDVAATVEEPGDITLPARKFIDLCRAVPEETEISLKVHKQRASITAGRSRFSLSTLPATDFPLMESGVGDETIEMDQGSLKELLEKTGFAMAHQDVRYYLNGLLLKVEPRGVTAVATDGHRLAKVEQNIELPVSGELQIILPRKSVIELSRLLDYSEARVRIDLSERMLRTTLGSSTLTSKLVDGRYPDYQRVIPILADKVATVDRESLRQSLLRTSILSNEKFKGIRLGFNQDRLTLQAHNPEQEEAEEEVEIEYEQEPVAIGFNVAYLIDVLGVVDEERVEFRFTDSNSSALLRGSGREDQTFVVMPMRL